MKCADVSRLLSAYADGELDPKSQSPVEAHLRGCSRCRATLAGIEALGDAVVRACPSEPAPDSLRRGVEAALAGGPAPRRWGAPGAWLAAAPGVAALLVAGWLALAQPWNTVGGTGAAEASRVVFHIAGSDEIAGNLRTIKNHLDAMPGLRAVVVAHSDGIKFLVQGARDAEGRPFAPLVRELSARGVEFRICTNTLARNHIDARTIVPEAIPVPSGIAEISRLQIQGHYTYLRL